VQRYADSPKMSNQSTPYRALGLMSGTSLDGLDLALIEWEPPFRYRWVATETIPYDAEWRNRLSNSPSLDGAALLTLDHAYGNFLAMCIDQFLEKVNASAADLNFIAVAGHTVHHMPELGYTYQLGCGPEIYAALGVKVVSDFRKQDLALGGQGAPLVPMGDRDLFGDKAGCLNLGGFANLTVLNRPEVQAYDLCVCNLLLNRLANQAGLAYDAGGELSLAGSPIPRLLSALEDLPYFQLSPPKSLAWEWVRDEVWPLFQAYNQADLADRLATARIWIARSIARELAINRLSEVMVTGGGAYNTALLAEIEKEGNCQMTLPEPALIEFKEALIFVYLAWLRLSGKANTLRSVTGASRDHSSGIVYG